MSVVKAKNIPEQRQENLGLSRRQLGQWVSVSLFMALTMPLSHAQAHQHKESDLTKLRDTDRTLGDPEAPVAIIAYESFTCHHCARFHETVYHDVKKRLVETGKASFSFRDFPLDGASLKASALARCFKGKHFFAFVEEVFRNQKIWIRNPEKELIFLAGLAGLESEKAQACLNDKNTQNTIIEERLHAQRSLDISSTPRFTIGPDIRIEGVQEIEIFERAVEEAGRL